MKKPIPNSCIHATSKELKEMSKKEIMKVAEKYFGKKYHQGYRYWDSLHYSFIYPSDGHSTLTGGRQAKDKQILNVAQALEYMKKRIPKKVKGTFTSDTKFNKDEI